MGSLGIGEMEAQSHDASPDDSQVSEHQTPPTGGLPDLHSREVIVIKPDNRGGAGRRAEAVKLDGDVGGGDEAHVEAAEVAQIEAHLAAVAVHRGKH